MRRTRNAVIPVELQLLRNVLDRRLPTALAHVMGKALRIERVVRQEIEPLALHLAATAASHPPDLDLQEDARVAARQIAKSPARPTLAPCTRFLSIDSHVCSTLPSDLASRR